MLSRLGGPGLGGAVAADGGLGGIPAMELATPARLGMLSEMMFATLARLTLAGSEPLM